MFLEVKNLCFNYYRKPLCLKDINFSCKKQEKVLLLASHEMGKTAFLSVVCGFEKSYYGSILIDGKELKKIDESNLSVSFLPESPVFLKNKNVYQNLNFASETANDISLSFEDAKKLCEENGLNMDLKTKVKNLSSVQKKALAVIRSFLKNADIIFVDDQLSNLCEADANIILKVYERLLNNNQILFLAVDENNFKKHKNFIKNAKFDKIFYLCDAKLRIFNNIDEFEKKILTYDMLKFFDKKYYETKCVIERQDKFYNIYFGEKFFSLNTKFNKFLDVLNLSEEDTEYAYLCTNEEVNISGISENEFNEVLARDDTLLFSSLSGERLI